MDSLTIYLTAGAAILALLLLRHFEILDWKATALGSLLVGLLAILTRRSSQPTTSGDETSESTNPLNEDAEEYEPEYSVKDAEDIAKEVENANTNKTARDYFDAARDVGDTDDSGG